MARLCKSHVRPLFLPTIPLPMQDTLLFFGASRTSYASVSLRYTRAHDKLCFLLPPTLYLRLLSSSPTVLRYTSRSHEAPDTVFWRQVTAESQSAKECVFVLKLMYMLWFNFIPGLNFISLCFGVW